MAMLTKSAKPSARQRRTLAELAFAGNPYLRLTQKYAMQSLRSLSVALHVSAYCLALRQRECFFKPPPAGKPARGGFEFPPYRFIPKPKKRRSLIQLIQ